MSLREVFVVSKERKCIHFANIVITIVNPNYPILMCHKLIGLFVSHILNFMRRARSKIKQI
jgi:hypothetical protein